jgi:hypothetical protein
MDSAVKNNFEKLKEGNNLLLKLERNLKDTVEKLEELKKKSDHLKENENKSWK